MKKEFSKIVIVAMIALWFVTAAFGAFEIAIGNGDIGALFEYVGMPMTGGIVAYLLKSAYENKEKIKGSNELFEIDKENTYAYGKSSSEEVAEDVVTDCDENESEVVG